MTVDRVDGWLYDAHEALRLVHEFINGRTYEDFQSDSMLRAAVERQLMIVGEAFVRIRRVGSPVEQQIPSFSQIIAFRNILVHGYDGIDDTVVWKVITQDAAVLIAQLKRMIDARLDASA